MSALQDARVELAGKVAAEGLRVVTDPRDVNPPCVLIGPPATIVRRAGCGLEAAVPVLIIAPPPGNEDALVWQLDTLEVLYSVLPAVTDAAATVVAVAGADAPAYELTARIVT